MGLVLDSVSCLVCTSLPVSDFAIVLSSLLNDSLLSKEASTHRPHSSSCLGLPYRILHQKGTTMEPMGSSLPPARAKGTRWRLILGGSWVVISGYKSPNIGYK